jgi:hypothetical protein
VSARDWSREPYRKLLLRPSASFRSLSVTAQGIAYVIIREADDDGRIPFDVDLRKGCAKLHRLLGVEPRERDVFDRRLQELLADGCLVHEGAFLVWPNLPSINARRDEKATTRVRTGRDEGATGVRPTHEMPTTGVRDAHDLPTTSPPPRRETISSAENHSPESASRARVQVGRKVGRQSSTAGEEVARERPSVPEVPENDPIAALLDSATVFAGEDVQRIVRSARLLVRGRREDDELFEIADFAASATVRAVGTGAGIAEGKVGAYFLKTFEGLLANGGLEAAKDERAPRPARPRSATPTQGPVEFDPQAFAAGRRRRAGGES